jgi:hypothetical protein
VEFHDAANGQQTVMMVGFERKKRANKKNQTPHADDPKNLELQNALTAIIRCSYSDRIPEISARGF